MTSSDPTFPDSFTWSIVRRAARRLSRSEGFCRCEYEDLVQELILRVLQSLPQFDPAQAHRNVFVTTVVQRNAAMIRRQRRAKKRTGRQVFSLETLLVEGDEAVPELARDSGAVREAELGLDVAVVLARLPKELRKVAECLSGQSLSQAARTTSVPRTTLQRRVEELRDHFRAAGLDFSF